MPSLVTAHKATRFGYGIAGPGAGDDLMPALLAPPAQSARLSAERILEEHSRRQKLAAIPRDKRMQAQRDFGRWLDGLYLADQHAHLASAVIAPSPFFSRLTEFWANHFTVSSQTRTARGLAGPYVKEAIEPHVLGRFEDMLLAAELHPAMMIYLDLINSVGPNSPFGRQRGKGLNENLAREILELHTLGVNGGYSQADVTEFAKIMTGWIIDRPKGIVRFAPRRAEPGTKLLLGQTIGGKKAGQGDYPAALRQLADHPSTARFVATKLVTHFIADTPPAAAVDKLEAAFKKSGGDLPAVYRALLDLPEAGQPTGAKARTDFEFVVAALRAIQISSPELEPVKSKNGRLLPNRLSIYALNRMQQRLWAAPSPAGWPERAEEWLAPTALAQRLDWIPEAVREITDQTTAEFLDRVLGPLASERTRKTVLAASNREEGMALVLASPEFNRR